MERPKPGRSLKRCLSLHVQVHQDAALGQGGGSELKKKKKQILKASWRKALLDIVNIWLQGSEGSKKLGDAECD